MFLINEILRKFQCRFTCFNCQSKKGGGGGNWIKTENHPKYTNSFI